MQELLAEMPRNHIINIDENNWLSMAGGIWTYAATECGSAWDAVDKDERKGVIVMAAIPAAGNKLPFTVIGKGKTPRCLAGFNLPTPAYPHLPSSKNVWIASYLLPFYETSS
jgi:hypothetical protein